MYYKQLLIKFRGFVHNMETKHKIKILIKYLTRNICFRYRSTQMFIKINYEKKLTGSFWSLINKNTILSSDVETECEAKFSISFNS